jgi:hypothetical protein
MEAAATPPPEYDKHEGCAALGGHSTLRSPRCFYERINATVCRGRGAGVSCAVFLWGFHPAGKCGARKGGVDDLGKLLSEAKRNGAILTFWFLPGGGRGFCAPLGEDGFTKGNHRGAQKGRL